MEQGGPAQALSFRLVGLTSSGGRFRRLNRRCVLHFGLAFLLFLPLLLLPELPLPFFEAEICFRHISSALQIGSGLLAALGHNVEADALPFGQGTQARPLDRADMDEHVLTITIGLDEAEALLRVEPLYSANSHYCLQTRIEIRAHSGAGTNNSNRGG